MNIRKGVEQVVLKGCAQRENPFTRPEHLFTELLLVRVNACSLFFEEEKNELDIQGCIQQGAWRPDGG